MFFAGEVVDELKMGIVSPLPKNLEAFRPVTLLEPLYKCCMATMSGKVLRFLHEYGLLDAAQFGFVVDGSCTEPLKIMARVFENGRGDEGEKLHESTSPSSTRRRPSTQCRTQPSTRH